MSDEASISAAAQAVSKQIGAGGLNLLINNAAVNKPASPAPLSATGKKDMMEVYETNVVGPFLLAKVSLSRSVLTVYIVCVHTQMEIHRQKQILTCHHGEKQWLLHSLQHQPQTDC